MPIPSLYPLFLKAQSGAIVSQVFTEVEFTLEPEPDITVDTDDTVITVDPDISIQAEADVQVESD